MDRNGTPLEIGDPALYTRGDRQFLVTIRAAGEGSCMVERSIATDGTQPERADDVLAAITGIDAALRAQGIDPYEVFEAAARDLEYIGEHARE